MIHGRNFYDQPTSDQIRKYDEVRTVALGKGEDYATGSLLDFKYYKYHYQLIACDLSKQKELDADPRSIQQLELNFMLDTSGQILTVLEKSKETIKFSKGTAKDL